VLLSLARVVLSIIGTGDPVIPPGAFWDQISSSSFFKSMGGSNAEAGSTRGCSCDLIGRLTPFANATDSRALLYRSFHDNLFPRDFFLNFFRLFLAILTKLFIFLPWLFLFWFPRCNSARVVFLKELESSWIVQFFTPIITSRQGELFLTNCSLFHGVFDAPLLGL